ncbi:MAG TPA: tetratricopeptide repeat protein [Gemmatimonadales bacterium]
MLLATAAAPGVLLSQAAIDPNVAPRAAALEREGERQMAIDLLGRYLATAPDDGRAWLQLGRFYLYDAREWHLHGHGGDPDGLLYLDFAATALEQAVRLSVDSGLVFRGLAEVERALIVVEDSGWERGRFSRPGPGTPAVPPYMVELGLNLLQSCPSGGVLLTGNDLETLSVWYGSNERPSRDIIPIRPALYATDSLYRRRMAEAMEVDPSLPVQRALATVAPRRAVCLSPGTDSAAVPSLTWAPFRLVRVSRPPTPGGEALSVTELLKATRQSGSPWVLEVRGVYDGAARHNALLCSSLLLLYGDSPPPACRP